MEYMWKESRKEVIWGKNLSDMVSWKDKWEPNITMYMYEHVTMKPTALLTEIKKLKVLNEYNKRD